MTDYSVPEDKSRLSILALNGDDIAPVMTALRADQVVLVRDVSPQAADRIIAAVTEQLGLRSQLDLQTAFASIHGHRSNVGRHFMTVNKRSDYQFIPSHSEGTRMANMQLAALYCYENTTDGGESILMNTYSESPMWDRLRAVTKKVDLGGRRLSPAEIAGAKMMYQISIPDDLLGADDQILRELPSPVPGVKLFEVLEKPVPSHSRILERDVHVYWDNVASTDFDSGEEYLALLKATDLLRKPLGGMQIEQLDNAWKRRVWRSGMRYASLFKGKITHKLCPGDMIIQNNLTWTHSTANWTPNSGERKVAASFA